MRAVYHSLHIYAALIDLSEHVDEKVFVDVFLATVDV